MVFLTEQQMKIIRGGGWIQGKPVEALSHWVRTKKEIEIIEGSKVESSVVWIYFYFHCAGRLNTFALSNSSLRCRLNVPILQTPTGDSAIHYNGHITAVHIMPFGHGGHGLWYTGGDDCVVESTGTGGAIGLADPNPNTQHTAAKANKIVKNLILCGCSTRIYCSYYQNSVAFLYRSMTPPHTPAYQVDSSTYMIKIAPYQFQYRCCFSPINSNPMNNNRNDANVMRGLRNFRRWSHSQSNPIERIILFWTRFTH